MPTAAELVLLVIIIASIEMIIYLMQYILGRYFSEEWVINAKDNLIALGVLFIVALLIISPVFQMILNVFQIAYLQAGALDRLNEIRISAGEWFAGLLVINAVVSFLKNIEASIGIASGKPFMFLDPLDRILDTTIPFFTYLMIFANFLYKLMEFFVNHFHVLTALGALVLVPKITRPVGASLISFSVAMAVVFPALLYGFYYIHSYDYSQSIQELESYKNQLQRESDSLLSKIISGAVNIMFFGVFAPVIDNIINHVLEYFGNIAMDLFVFPVVSFIISLMFSLWMYRLLNMENLEDRIATAFLGIVSMRGRI